MSRSLCPQKFPITFDKLKMKFNLRPKINYVLSIHSHNLCKLSVPERLRTWCSIP